MTESEIHNAWHTLKAHAFGGFASRLAEAWFYADSTNKEKLNTAFAELVQRGHEFNLAEMRREA